MANTSGGPVKGPTLKPQDAATLVIVDRTAGQPRVLMGKRRMDQVFMPGKFVFPGGRVDPDDRAVESADELQPIEVAKLLLRMKGTRTGSRARAIALAAIRETFEEAGLLIGLRSQPSPALCPPNWSGFFVHGFRPRLGALTMFARAITPPGRPRRYDTRFFCCDADAIAHRVDTLDGELSGLHWLTIEEARRLDLPAITRVILEDLTDHLEQRNSADPPSIPYYHHKNGSFRRELLELDPT
jgi:8-oxo-dGTP pyrophosphatase MutT (NUDIX family)